MLTRSKSTDGRCIARLVYKKCASTATPAAAAAEAAAAAAAAAVAAAAAAAVAAVSMYVDASYYF